jgi:hypothetical protein
MCSHPRNRQVRFDAGELELHVPIEELEALIAAQLGPSGPEQTLQKRIVPMRWLLTHLSCP